ncbi:NAD(P)-binding protein [Teratosphaeria destructans]|uniref:NAD(P)-binding protein n=1 Tax=Teratosphaeria destructans TaxID=418781 RepID=A0A9W7W0T7_9PEZI|nr:NAD(P)-binding protein [Teratosphaeria destructans]
MQSAARFFFSQPTFAVAGASSNPHKFGHKIFAWYLAHDLHAIPINPTMSSVEVQGQHFDTIASVAELKDPARAALSVITPPAVTAKVLREAKAAGVRAVWLQPGAFTEEELEYAVQNFPGGAVAGFAGGTVGAEGWCVLVDGEAAMSAAGTAEKL